VKQFYLRAQVRGCQLLAQLRETIGGVQKSDTRHGKGGEKKLTVKDLRGVRDNANRRPRRKEPIKILGGGYWEVNRNSSGTLQGGDKNSRGPFTKERGINGHGRLI